MSCLYKKKLSSIIYDDNKFYDSNSTVWTELTPLITEEVLVDAHRSCKKYEEVFVGMGVESRPLKTMKRIEIKKQANRPDVPFKVNSDLCAVRLPTYDIASISSHMVEIRKRVLEEEGLFYLRNNIMDGQTVTDIIQYAFVYIPRIGYIAEIQVGHPFAIYTFTIDSIIRDKRLEGVSLDGIVDLWDNGFYTFVKSFILNKCNNKNKLEVQSLEDFINMYPTKNRMLIDETLMKIIRYIIIN
jgi:hypothetical protein